MSRLAVVAVGGNSLIVDKHHQTIPDQFKAAAITMRYVADMIATGWNVVITHGNGPQIGYILRRSQIASTELHPVPMDYAGADTQGAIGYMFQKALRNEFRQRSLDADAATIVTQVLVNHDDPAFTHPTKPIGPFMVRDIAQTRAKKLGWTVLEDPGHGWRRTVPSPLPLEIIELKAIRRLSEAGFVVVACGGGGIPVIQRESGDLRGVEAVIDKDLVSSLLARLLEANLFVISTSVEKVAINYRKPAQQWLDTITLSEARQHHAKGHFPPGSMGPKIDAMTQFVEETGNPGIITDPLNLGLALQSKTGTHFIPD